MASKVVTTAHEKEEVSLLWLLQDLTGPTSLLPLLSLFCKSVASTNSDQTRAWEIKQNEGIESVHNNPFLGPKTEILIEAGGKWVPFIVARGESWRLLTATFPHAGLGTRAPIIFTLSSFGFELGRACTNRKRNRATLWQLQTGCYLFTVWNLWYDILWFY
jgi:hypothetical protein